MPWISASLGGFTGVSWPQLPLRAIGDGMLIDRRVFRTALSANDRTVPGAAVLSSPSVRASSGSQASSRIGAAEDADIPAGTSASLPFGSRDCGLCSRANALFGQWPAVFGMGVVAGGIGLATKIWMHWLNDTVIYNGQEVSALIAARPPGTALITVSNHISSIDDPLIVAPLIPWSHILRPSKIRWTMCATDRCFTSWFVTNLTICGRVLPIARGQGVDQLGMQLAVQKLNDGDWIHIFPEGTRSVDNFTIGSMKPGIGRLIAAADKPPIVVPVYHRGVNQVFGRGFTLPRVNKRVDIMVGEPIDFGPLLAQHRERGTPEKEVHQDVARRIGVALHHLQQKLEHQQPSHYGARHMRSAVNEHGLRVQVPMIGQQGDEVPAAVEPEGAANQSTAGTHTASDAVTRGDTAGPVQPNDTAASSPAKS